MKLTFPRPELVQTLKLMQSVLDRTTKMPVLKYVRVTTAPTHVTLAASDLELGLERTIPLNCPETRTFLIPTDTMLDFVRELNTPTILWTLDNKQSITVSAGKTKAKVNTLEATDYPGLPQAPDPLLFSLPTADFTAILDETMPAVGEQDTRYILNAIRLRLTEQHGPTLEGVGTDGKRLVVTSRTTGTWLTKDHEDKVMLVPKKVGKVLKTMMSAADDTTIGIGLSKNLAGFKIGPMLLTSRLMEGQYPNFQQVIPKETSVLFTIPKLQLEDPLRRVSVINGRDGKPIHLTIRSKEIVLKAVNVDMGEATETIETASDSPELTVGFNTHYLIDALETMPGDHCHFSMANPLAPCLLRTPEQKNWLHIVMPVKV